MAREADWPRPQFDILMDALLSDADVHERTGRSIDAVKIVRSFVHSWHGDLSTSGLSKTVMLPALEESRGSATCPYQRCKQPM
jgi:hypothetical protein